MKTLNKIVVLALLFTLLAGFNPRHENPSENAWIKEIVKKLDVTEYFLTLDRENNLIITGYFLNTTHFEDQKLVSVGNYDVFIAKYSSEGKLLWVNQSGGSEADFVKMMKLDDNNAVYITGCFSGVAFFGDYIARSKGRSDVFTAKYASDGKLQWVKSLGAEIICEPNSHKRRAYVQKYLHN